MKQIPVLQRQRGVNTLFVTLILLLLAGLVVFYTARGAITEQRLSANELRQKQAFAAASAGLEHAMAYFAKDGVDQVIPFARDRVLNNTDNESEFPADPISGMSTIFTTETGERPSYYGIRYCAPGVLPPPCPVSHLDAFDCTHGTPGTPEGRLHDSNLRNPLIVSCGWSDDDSAVVRLVQGGSRAPTLPGKITAPVVTKGVTNLNTGGVSIFNYFNDLTVWAGSGAVTTGSNTCKTFIRDVSTDPVPSSTRDFRATGNSPGCNNVPAGYNSSTGGGVVGHDMIVNDTNLDSLNRDQFFAKFMTPSDPDGFRDSATWKVDLNNGMSGEDSNSANSLAGKQDAVIWVEGNLSGNLGTIGSVDRPVIMVINGNWDLGANAEIYGVVFVRGDVNGNGGISAPTQKFTVSSSCVVTSMAMAGRPFMAAWWPSRQPPPATLK
jgi:hypothetical protein